MDKDQGNRKKNSQSIEPIRGQQEINRVRSVLDSKPRDLLLFDLAIQTGARMKDLLGLRMKDLMGLNVGDSLPIPKYGIGKPSDLVLTDTLYKAFQRYQKEVGLKPEDYVFKSKKGRGPLNLSSVSNMIKGWFKDAQIEGACGARSLRKTWEYSRSFASDPVNPAEKVDSLGFLERITTDTAQEKAYQLLAEAIVSGKIPPGTRLTISDICTRFGVSPMPVRMAIHKLQAKGFVRPQKKKASIVMDFSEQRFEEMKRIRIALETLAAKLSYQVCTNETLRIAEGLIQVLAHAKTLEEWLPANAEFHFTLFRDAQSPMLQELIADIIDKIRPYMVALSAGKDRIDFPRTMAMQIHQKMLDAMQSRDLDALTKWIETDITEGSDIILRALQSYKSSE